MCDMNITQFSTISFLILGLLGCGSDLPSSQELSTPDNELSTPDNELPDSNIDTHFEAVAPFSFTRYQNMLSNSSLQVSDPKGDTSNKTTMVKNGAFSGYWSPYFYAQKETGYLVFKMENYKMRSEVRELDNFSINETGVTRTLYAEVRLPEIDLVMANSPADHDEVTFLQIHNKGTDTDGTGYIPHPLLRIVWEQERNSITGHYWAVIKTNAFDCTQKENLPYCGSSYTRYDLGAADLDNFTRFDVSIGSNTLAIKVNGDQKVAVDVSYWEPLLSYFKAGVYNQFENGEAEVQFKQLSLMKTK